MSPSGENFLKAVTSFIHTHTHNLKPVTTYSALFFGVIACGSGPEVHVVSHLHGFTLSA